MIAAETTLKLGLRHKVGGDPVLPSKPKASVLSTELYFAGLGSVEGVAGLSASLRIADWCDEGGWAPSLSDSDGSYRCLAGWGWCSQLPSGSE